MCHTDCNGENCELKSTGMRLQEYYDFGLQEVVQSLFANPQWAALRGTGRNMCSGGLYGSTMSQELNAKTNGALYKEENSIWELGFDFCQIFNFAKHSTGVVFIRYGHADSQQILLPGWSTCTLSSILHALISAVCGEI